MRTRMVTRTIKTTEVNCMVVNTETAIVEYAKAYITGVTDAKAIEKLARKQVETDTIKFVSIHSTETFEAVYGMPEDMFIVYAKMIDR